MIDSLVKRPNGSGSKAYQRADGRWVAKITMGRRDGRQWQRGFYGPTAEAAERKRDEAMRRLGLGADVDDPATPLSDYLADWLRRQEVKGLAPSTLSRYRQIVAHQIEPMLGSVAIGRVTTQRVEGLLEELARDGLAPRTIFHVRAVLRNALGRATRRRTIDTNPAGDVEMPVREPTEEQRALELDEAVRLIKALERSRWRAACIVAMTTGLREGEVLRLRWDHVDMETRGLHVPGTKTKKSKATIGLPETATAALREWRREQAVERLHAGDEWPAESDGLIFTRPDGRPASKRVVLDHLQRAAREAGLGHLTFHQLRHTAGSLLQAEGVDLKTIQRVLRHATIATTDRYVHVVDAALHDAAERMDAAITRAGQLLPVEPGEPPALIDLPRPDVAALRARYVRRGRRPHLDPEVLGVLDQIAACTCTGVDVEMGQRWNAATIAGARRGANVIKVLVATHEALHGAPASAEDDPALPVDADAVRAKVIRGLAAQDDQVAAELGHAVRASR